MAAQGAPPTGAQGSTLSQLLDVDSQIDENADDTVEVSSDSVGAYFHNHLKNNEQDHVINPILEDEGSGQSLSEDEALIQEDELLNFCDRDCQRRKMDQLKVYWENFDQLKSGGNANVDYSDPNLNVGKHTHLAKHHDPDGIEMLTHDHDPNIAATLYKYNGESRGKADAHIDHQTGDQAEDQGQEDPVPAINLFSFLGEEKKDDKAAAYLVNSLQKFPNPAFKRRGRISSAASLIRDSMKPENPAKRHDPWRQQHKNNYNDFKKSSRSSSSILSSPKFTLSSRPPAFAGIQDLFGSVKKSSNSGPPKPFYSLTKMENGQKFISDLGR